MMLGYVVFAALLSVTYAQPAQPQPQVLPYVVRIIAFDAGGQSFGTGSYVGTYGEYGIILTNWHVVSETNGLVHVHFPSGFSTYGARIKGDSKWDLAVIAISKPPPSIPMLPIAKTAAKIGDPLWIVGFGSGWDAYRVAEGRCVRYMAPENPTDGTPAQNDFMEVSVSARKGDSGGPILNQKGELAAVLFGSDMVRNTAGSYCERVNRFLMETRSVMEGLPARPETCFASIEKNGPLHKLRDSRNAVPQNAVPGIQQPPQQGMQRSQNTAPGIPLSALQPSELLPLQGMEPALAESSPKIGASYQPVNVVQVAHLIPLEPLRPVRLLAMASPGVERYPSKLYSEQGDPVFSWFLSINAILAVGLTFFAVRLLRET
jgi:hypothetical protein